MTKINLYVVYEDKDLAKRDGAFYDSDLKTWQCEENNKICIEKYKKVYFNADILIKANSILQVNSFFYK